MRYDRDEWHSGGDYPADLPPENGGTHIGMFLAWAILHGLEGDFHRAESQADLDAVRSRQLTGRDFLFRACDGKFWDEDLSDEGNAFARWYYAPGGGGYGPYLEDYQQVLAAGLPTEYHVENSWENFDKLAPVIDRRFREWQKRSGRKSRGPTSSPGGPTDGRSDQV